MGIPPPNAVLMPRASLSLDEDELMFPQEVKVFTARTQRVLYLLIRKSISFEYSMELVQSEDPFGSFFLRVRQHKRLILYANH